MIPVDRFLVLQGHIFFFFFIIVFQDWEFAHLFSERIAGFLPKSEQMSDSLKKVSDSLIFGEQTERFTHDRSFLWATCSSRSLSFGERPEQFAHIAQREWATVSESLRLLTKYERMSKPLMFLATNEWFAQKTNDQLPPPPENLCSEICAILSFSL